MKKIDIMGIVNVTTDSFYDGGKYISHNKAIEQAIKLWEDGADIIDIGGESSRPGAKTVSESEELDRVIPVVENLSQRGIKISVDTWRSKVMAESISAGAKIINDITALTGDSDSLRIIAKAGVEIVLMHMQGQPHSMQKAPFYHSVSHDVRDFLLERTRVCQEAGVLLERIIIDPGIGFGKTLEHNLEIMANIHILKENKTRILMGVSRKSFISMQCGNIGPSERLPGSLAAALYTINKGADIVRVHDVKETKQAIEIWQAITQKE